MDTSPPDNIIEALVRRREIALRRLAQAQAVLREATEMERKALKELTELETTERVLKAMQTQSTEPTVDASLTAPIRHMLRRAREVDATDADVRRISETSPLHTGGGRHVRSVALELCAQLLAKGAWMHTDELLTRLEGMGHVIRAANPQQRLSQMLSADDRFETQRGRGWRLKGTLNSLSGDPHFDEQLRRRAAHLIDTPTRRSGGDPGT